MKAAVAWLFAFGCILAALAALVPASMIDHRLNATTGGKVRLADPAGTVWHGRGAVTDGRNTWRVPVAWRISKSAVARGMHEIVLQPGESGSTARGTVNVVEDGVAVRDVNVDVPARVLAGVLPARVSPELGGTVSITSSAFAWNSKDASGAIALRWRDARLVVGEAVADLGLVDIAVAPQGNALSGRITNSGGSVRIDGTVTLAGPNLAVDATATPSPAAPAALARALAALGPPDANGSVRIAWRGTLQ